MLCGRKEQAISQPYSLAFECANDGWDGDGARAIAPTAITRVAEFVRAMPDGLPLPEFAPEPDGSISLDWITSRTRVFSLSIGTNDRIAYAWIDGTDRGHGVAPFAEDTIPPSILAAITEIVK